MIVLKEIILNAVTEIINRRREEYFDQLATKLNNPKPSSKIYLSILKTFHNGRKISLIPQLLGNTCFISDFKTNATFFNQFFASQYTPLENSSIICKYQ